MYLWFFLITFPVINLTATGHGDNVVFFRNTLSFLYQNRF